MPKRKFSLTLSSTLLVSYSFILSFPRWTVQQEYGNCPGITLQDLGTGSISNQGLISQIIGQDAAINATQIICQSPGTLTDTFRSTVANVMYETVTEYFSFVFAFECNASNTWTFQPSQFVVSEHIPQSTRNDCSFCSPVVPLNYSENYSSESFCFVCPNTCGGSGLCYGDINGTVTACCSYYYNSSCVESCPVGTTPNSELDCVTIPTPTVPELLILKVGQSLFLNCGSDLFTITKDPGEHFNSSILNITSVSLDNAGIYLCELADGTPSSSTSVAIAQMNSSPVFITDNTLQAIANDSIINSNDNDVISIGCWSPSGHGRLRWHVENASTNAEQLRDEFAIAEQSSQHTFFVGNTIYGTLFIVTTNPLVHGFFVIINAMSSSNSFIHFLSCRSDESGEQQFVIITDNETYVDSHGTDTNPFLGQTLTLIFRVSTVFNISVTLEQNHTGILNTPVQVSSQQYEMMFRPTIPTTAGFYNFSVFNTQTAEFLASTTLVVTTRIPALQSSGNITTREGENVTLSCIPSDPDVEVWWEKLVDIEGAYNFQLISSNEHFQLLPERLTTRLKIVFITRSDQVFRCSVAGNSIFQTIYVTVLERCDASLAAGLLWSTSYTGDIISYRCSAVDPRFSSTVRVSRLCARGTWTPLDFSNCTLSAYHDPFILIWFYVNSTAYLNESRIINEITRSVFPNNTKIIHTSASIQVVSLVDALLGWPSTPSPSTGQILYQANFAKGNEPVFLGSTILGTQTIIGENIQSLRVDTGHGIYYFEGSSECSCLPYFIGVPVASTNILRLCVGEINSPCSCTIPPTDDLLCAFPGEGSLQLDLPCNCNQFYAGNGSSCTLDSDGDSYPDQPINCSSISQLDLPSYCFQDTCPTIYNIPQSDTSPCMASAAGSTQCVLEIDSVFGIQWGYTLGGATVNQFCGPNFIGNATRFCFFNGTWAEPNVTGCLGVAFAAAREQALNLMSEEPSLETVLSIQDTLATLVEATSSSPSNISALPSDLQVTAEYLLAVVNYYSGIVNEGLTDITLATTSDMENILDIASNAISTNNLPGAMYLTQDDPTETFAQDILEVVEEYGLYLATYLDLLMDTGAKTNMTILAAENILLNPTVIVVNELMEDAVFPPMNTSSIMNVTGAMFNSLEEASITIPKSFIQQRATTNNVTRVKVSNVIFQNLEVFLSLNRENETLEPAAVVLSSQVQQRMSDPNADLTNPIRLRFIATNKDSSQNFTCVFWDFRLRNGLGGWSTTGVTTVNVTDVRQNQTAIQCTSTHLTSFSVLVNVAGSNVNSKALQILSYIGIGLSLACLLFAIIFFLSFGKALFTAVHNFVHLNLAIALFLAYLTFALGIELAARNREACHFVVALLQYLFLAVFCWMLCEGVMLYLMLVVVFSKLSKKWWFFLLLGWLPPLLFVIIGLASALEQYGVYDESNILQFCWLASGGKNFAIWFFVVPMIIIIIINTVFLILVLSSVIRSQRNKQEVKEKSSKRIDIVISTVKASVILLPLIGLTWIIGLFAVSQNTVAFAWIFAILNTLQGVFILFFHVLRHQRIWGKFKKKYHLFESTSKSRNMNSVTTYNKENIHGKYRSTTGSATISSPSKVPDKYATAPAELAWGHDQQDDIFDENDTQVPTISLRLNSVKESSHGRWNASKETSEVQDMEVEEKVILFSEEGQVQIECTSKIS